MTSRFSDRAYLWYHNTGDIYGDTIKNVLLFVTASSISSHNFSYVTTGMNTIQKFQVLVVNSSNFGGMILKKWSVEA